MDHLLALRSAKQKTMLLFLVYVGYPYPHWDAYPLNLLAQPHYFLFLQNLGYRFLSFSLPEIKSLGAKTPQIDIGAILNLNRQPTFSAPEKCYQFIEGTGSRKTSHYMQR